MPPPTPRPDSWGDSLRSEFERLLQLLVEESKHFYGDRLAGISAWLRKEREFAFDGDIDFIPTEQYSPDQGERALNDARFVVDVVGRLRDATSSGG